MKSFFAYLQASRIELTKVSWPNRRQTLRLTMMVIVFAFIFAFGLGAVDYLFTSFIQKVILKG
jgi:preprotein translocase subunit SecE